MTFPFILGSNRSDYQIANSLRFRNSVSAYLSRTPSVTGSQTKFTFAGWIKRGTMSDVTGGIFGARTDANNFSGLSWYSPTAGNPTLAWLFQTSASWRAVVNTNMVFRDPLAWYHIVVNMDTSQTTGSGLYMRVWVNGVLQTLTVATAPNGTGTTLMNTSSIPMYLGYDAAYNRYDDAYYSEIHYIDGQNLDASNFGQFNSDGVWIPKKYIGTYGTNGFYLKFNDGSNLTNLCLDRSGNGNNWTATNVSLTAGATYDWMVDTPTNNYAVLNALTKTSNVGMLFANLYVQEVTSSTSFTVVSTIGVSSGKWYFEASSASGNNTFIGISTKETGSAVALGSDATGYSYIRSGQKYNAGTASAYGASYTNGDTIAAALDMDAGTLTFYKNNASQGVAFSGLSGTVFLAVGGTHDGFQNNIYPNFGQRPFTYTPPSGFKALCTANLPAVTVTNGRKNFDVLLHTGNGGAQSVTGAQFQPDFAITKARSQANSHTYYDVVRGATNALFSNTTGAELNYSAYLAGFLSNGVSFIGGGGDTNQSSQTYVNWLWKAGGAAVTNTAGSITSQVSANTAAGFSIVTYTGTGANATVGHGLGVAPKMVIVKIRTSGSTDWCVYHASTGATNRLLLSQTNASAADATMWNNTAPTSAVFSIGTNIGVNQNTGPTVAYCFAEVPGFSKFGSYTGNGSTDGPFVFCGFRPRYVMVKRTDVAANWELFDTARDPYNVMVNYLYPNLSSQELPGTGPFDFTSNGFKLRFTHANHNASGGTYIFAAFAENPFGGSNIAPATAR